MIDSAISGEFQCLNAHDLRAPSPVSASLFHSCRIRVCQALALIHTNLWIVPTDEFFRIGGTSRLWSNDEERLVSGPGHLQLAKQALAAAIGSV